VGWSIENCFGYVENGYCRLSKVVWIGLDYNKLPSNSSNSSNFLDVNSHSSLTCYNHLTDYLTPNHRNIMVKEAIINAHIIGNTA